MRSLLPLLLCAVLSLPTSGFAADDPRDLYDVQTYRLDLRVDPKTSTLSGTGVTAAKVVAESMDTLVLDLLRGREVSAVNAVEKSVTPDSKLSGPPLEYQRETDAIRIRLPRAAKKGDEVRVAVTYRFKPAANMRRTGIQFAKTPDGKPWITTACQNLGAQSWWPCKSETTHPEDKHASIFINATVPKGLTAVANGKLWKQSVPQKGWQTFHWRHDYPCEGYAVALNIAPYVLQQGTLKLPGLSKPLPYAYYVLPQDAEKAALQFKDAPRMLEIFSEAFGPWPFPEAKFGLVQVPYWGMEHSTVVAYGNSFPAWLKLHPGPDPHAKFNRLFDYILIHEVAHEWWGNAVSAADWGHFWIHEGFGTYAEGVYVEKMLGREEADRWFTEMRSGIVPSVPIYRGKDSTASAAYHINLYYKGANVLNTLRHYVNNDAAWWKAIKEFNLRYRYKNAVTEDFQAILEKEAGVNLRSFFQEWFYGKGMPTLKGTVSAKGKAVHVEVENPEREGTGFHVPLDLEWREGGQSKSKRVMLNPGSNQITIPCESEPSDIKVTNLGRVLGEHDVSVR
jgi:aminopeptidase N